MYFFNLPECDIFVPSIIDFSKSSNELTSFATVPNTCRSNVFDSYWSDSIRVECVVGLKLQGQCSNYNTLLTEKYHKINDLGRFKKNNVLILCIPGFTILPG